jgi:hypothetical protein
MAQKKIPIVPNRNISIAISIQVSPIKFKSESLINNLKKLALKAY